MLDAGRCDAIALSRNQRMLIAGTNGQVKCWDVPGGELRNDFPIERGIYKHIVALPGLRIAAWPTNSGFIACDLLTGANLQQVRANEPYVTGLAVTPDRSTLLTAATDGLIKGWKLNARGMAE